jgi:hypothetical protein
LCFDLGTVGFEKLLVGRIGAERLLAGQQEVAGKAGLYGDDVTDLAELLDTFEQDYVHSAALLISRCRGEARYDGRA